MPPKAAPAHPKYEDMVKAAKFDISAEDAMVTLKKLAEGVDLVISLLPPPCHVRCAEVRRLRSPHLTRTQCKPQQRTNK